MELFGCSYALFCKEKEESHGGDKEIKTIAGEMAQRLAALTVLKEDPALVPSTHISQLTTIRNSPVPGNSVPSSGFCGHSHTWTAHKLMWERKHATYTLQKKKTLKKINVVLLTKGPWIRLFPFRCQQRMSPFL